MSVLDQGGNAVDAAVATAFAMSVVEPFSSGMGGGGATLVVPTGGEQGDTGPQYYDHREEVALDGVVPDSGTGVPGFVAGMAELHEDHGKLEWSQVLAPAITLAEEGHPVSDFLADQLLTEGGEAATSDLPQFYPDGMPLAAGDLLVQTELAESLDLVAAEGPGAFYAGPLTAELSAVEGLDEASLEGYQVRRPDPARGPVGEFEVVSAAPPLVGATLIQQLQVAQAAGIADTEPGSADYVDIASRSWLVADRSVATVLGDPDFVDVPVAELTDPAANADLAQEATASGELPEPVAAAPGQGSGPGNTTHVTVVDDDGLVVSSTNTILSFWGSRQSVGGFFVNNTLTRFAVGTTSANVPEAGRRPTSWMAPTVLLDAEARPVLALGSPGGRQIPNILANVITRWALHGQPLDEAVEATRFHQEGEVLRVEGLPEEVATELGSRGYQIEVVPESVRLFGSVQALELDHDAGVLAGATDTRREGTWDARRNGPNQPDR
jgi:gamma-glutamyltranspeptidase/glutathione hydrolase